jgi:FkbM family methyltransferase
MLKSILKRTIRSLGFELHRYHPDRSDDARFFAMLTAHQVNLVFDIGANRGQFGRSLRSSGFRGRIVSFEPLSAAREMLLEASRNDPLWEIAPRAAIGGQDGEIELHVAGNSESSSVLNMLDNHLKAAPDSAYIGAEKSPLRRLDTLAAQYVHSDSILFMKIDTQGYEAQVLQGAPSQLENAIGLQLELSLIPLYEKQLLYDEMLNQLKVSGFQLWDVSPVFVDPRSSRLLQVDSTFFRD